MSARHSIARRGYTLIVIAALFVAFSVVAAALLERNTVSEWPKRMVATKEQLNRINLAIARYASYNAGRYPCPAPITYSYATDANFGIACTMTTNPCDTCAGGGSLTTLSGSTEVLRGMVPSRTLTAYGLDETDAFDAWNNRIFYVVNRQLTTGGSGIAASANRPTVVQATTGQTLAKPDFLLFSPGRDRFGAYFRNGAANASTCASSTEIRQENCDTDLNFTQAAAYVAPNADNTTYYDDVLTMYTGDGGCNGQNITWSTNCTGTTIPLVNGGSTSVLNTAGGYTGAVTVSCALGVLSQSGATCAASGGADCTTGPTETWLTNCSNTYATIAHGASAVINDNNMGYTGSVTLSCNNGVVSQSASSCTADSSCGGVTVGTFCWYLGALGQSCDTVCATHGGYNAATLSYAGSGGSDANCIAVLDAVGAIAGSMNNLAAATGCGTRTAAGVRRRDTNATTSSASGAAIQRACACNS